MTGKNRESNRKITGQHIGSKEGDGEFDLVSRISSRASSIRESSSKYTKPATIDDINEEEQYSFSKKDKSAGKASPKTAQPKYSADESTDFIEGGEKICDTNERSKKKSSPESPSTSPTKTTGRGRKKESNTANSQSSAVISEGPRPVDIVTGRGDRFYWHSGNRKFWKLILEYRDDYAKSESKIYKTTLAKQIVEYIELKFEARFIRYNPQTEEWHLQSAKEKIDKVKSGLRSTTIPPWVRHNYDESLGLDGCLDDDLQKYRTTTRETNQLDSSFESGQCMMLERKGMKRASNGDDSSHHHDKRRRSTSESQGTSGSQNSPQDDRVQSLVHQEGKLKSRFSSSATTVARAIPKINDLPPLPISSSEIQSSGDIVQPYRIESIEYTSRSRHYDDNENDEDDSEHNDDSCDDDTCDDDDDDLEEYVV